MSDKEILEALRNAECLDQCECIFGMYCKKKEEKGWCCYAMYPNGNEKEDNQGCIAQQAANLIERLMNKE